MKILYAMACVALLSGCVTQQIGYSTPYGEINTKEDVERAAGSSFHRGMKLAFFGREGYVSHWVSLDDPQIYGTVISGEYWTSPRGAPCRTLYATTTVWGKVYQTVNPYCKTVDILPFGKE